MTTYPFGDVLSVTTGYLLSDRGMPAVYELLNDLTGTSLYTHQLPRAAQECTPHLIGQHPWLAEITVPDNLNETNYLAWVTTLHERYGTEVDVAPLPPGVHERRDPLDELVETRPGKPVIVVAVPDGGGQGA